jgi:hypothetical protein
MQLRFYSRIGTADIGKVTLAAATDAQLLVELSRRHAVLHATVSESTIQEKYEVSVSKNGNVLCFADSSTVDLVATVDM